MLVKGDGNLLTFGTLLVVRLMKVYSKLDTSGRKGRGERLSLFLMRLAELIVDAFFIIDMEEAVVCPSTGPPCVLQEFKRISTTPSTRIIRHSLVYASQLEAA